MSKKLSFRGKIDEGGICFVGEEDSFCVGGKHYSCILLERNAAGITCCCCGDFHSLSTYFHKKMNIFRLKIQEQCKF